MTNFFNLIIKIYLINQRLFSLIFSQFYLSFIYNNSIFLETNLDNLDEGQASLTRYIKKKKQYHFMIEIQLKR